MAIKTTTAKPAATKQKKIGRPTQGRTLVSIRLDDRVLKKYRRKGKGWQTKLNEDIVNLMGLE